MAPVQQVPEGDADEKQQGRAAREIGARVLLPALNSITPTAPATAAQKSADTDQGTQSLRQGVPTPRRGSGTPG